MDQASNSQNNGIENVLTGITKEPRKKFIEEFERNMGMFFGFFSQPLINQKPFTIATCEDQKSLVQVSIRSMYEREHSFKGHILCFSGTILLLEVNERPELTASMNIDGVGCFQFGRRPISEMSDDYYVIPTPEGGPHETVQSIDRKYRMFVHVLFQLYPIRPTGFVRLINIQGKIGRNIVDIVECVKLAQPERFVFPIKVDYYSGARSEAAINELSLLNEVELTSIVFSADHKGDNTCSVCLSDFIVGTTLKKLICGHIFHENCISVWLIDHSSCPCCRYQYYETHLLLDNFARSGDRYWINLQRT